MDNDDRKIYDEIEEQLNKKRTVYSKQMLKTKKGKKGILLPFMVTLISLGLFALTLYGVYYFNNLQPQAQTTTVTVSEVGAINQIIKELKEQAELKIKDQEEQIAVLSDEIDTMKRAIGIDKSQIQNKIDKRKSEFEIEIDKSIANERTRLELLELAKQEIEKRLSEYETQLRLEYNNKLLAYRKQLENEITEKEKHLANLETEYRIKQEAALKQIEEIKRVAAEQQREYDKQLIALNAKMIQDMNAASTDLAELQQKKEREERVVNQLNSLYLTTNNLIGEKRYEEAKKQIETLRKFVYSELYLSIPTLVAGSEADLMMINLLSDYITIKETEKARNEIALQYDNKKDPHFVQLEEDYNKHINRAVDFIKANQLDLAIDEYKMALKTVEYSFSPISVFESILQKQESYYKENATLLMSKEFEAANSLDKQKLQDEFTKKMEALNQQVALLRTDISNLEAENRQLQNEKRALESAKIHVEQEEAQKDRTINALKRQNNQLSASLAARSSERDNLSSQNVKQAKQIKDLMAKIKNLESNQFNFEAQNSANDKLVSDKEKELQSTKTQIADLEKRLKESKEKAHALDLKIIDLETQLATQAAAPKTETVEVPAKVTATDVVFSEEYKKLMAENKDLMAQNEKLLSDMSDLKEKYSGIEAELTDAAVTNSRNDAISKEYQKIVNKYNRLNKNDPYALLSMENDISLFFSNPEVQQAMPGFSAIFRDYTRTLQDKANDQDKIYASMTNTVKEVASYPTKETMIDSINELIRYDQDNPFQIAFLNELKKMVQNINLE